MTIQALSPRFLEKIWGSHHLSPWFPDSTSKIGEVWLEGPAGEALPLLIKFLFTTERLSVQVHPDDDYALRHHQSNGKTEMWHILRAGPGAQVALGLKRQMTSAELRSSAESGAILDRLNWLDVRAGDTYFVRAGTIHAIGAGIALCEIQQQSDITYRLYDYGRARELHLDRSVEVADLGPYDPNPQPLALLASCKYFCTVRLVIEGAGTVDPGEATVRWLICIEGAGTIGGMNYCAGQAYQLDGINDPVPIQSSGVSVFLKTFVPITP